VKVAFIGLGTMGAPMARNLARAGHDVAVHDVSARAREPFKGSALRVAESPADAARDVQAVITMLPDSSHVRDALLGPGGACETLPRGALAIDMSTVAAAASLALGAELERRGYRMVDAPVGRTPRDAQAGTLLVVAGGAERDVAEARPLFDCIADTVVHAGPRGHGIKLKLVNNYMSAVGAVLAAEALALANKAGLDRDVTLRVLRSTTAGRGHLNVNFPRKVLAGDVAPDFPMRMAVKDMNHALALGAEVGSPLMLGGVAREMFALGGPWGRADEDWTAVLLLMEDLGRTAHMPPSRATETAT
jgi:4-hydroxybutyrate dehydrogenase/sulfolactaldehyde 3-reductase